MKYERALEGAEPLIVLTAVWQESDFVTLEEREEYCFLKQYSRGLTCHELGVQLSEDTRAVAATTARIRTIVAAAEFFHLLSKEVIRSKKHQLTATRKLHDLMRDVGKLNDDAMEQLGIAMLGSRNIERPF